MGILGNVLSSMMGNTPNSGGGLKDVLTNMLSGNNRQYYGEEQQGGLQGLLSTFENAGLGHIAQSWVSNGPNQNVTPEQLHQAFGRDRVNMMANQAGMEPQSFLEQLSQHLPNVVNGITPNGRVPDEGTISV